MKNNKTIVVNCILLFLTCLLLPIEAPAQTVTTRTLTLDDCVTMAQNESPAGRMVKSQFQRQYWQYRSFRSGLLPQLSLQLNSPGVVREINSVVQNDGTIKFVEQSQAFSEVNLSLSQEIPWTGTNISILSGLNRFDQFGDQDFYQWQARLFVLGLRQPLFQFNPLKWDTRLERLRFEIAQQAYLEALEEVAIDITQQFFNVYLAKINLEIAEFNAAINDTIFEISTGRYNVGKIAENDLLQTELALMNARTNLAESRLNYNRTEQELKIALNLSDDVALNLVPPVDLPDFVLDAEFAVQQAKANRSEWKNLQLQKLQARRDVAQAKGNNGLSATISASLGYNQTAEALEDLYEDPLDRQTFNMQVDIPLFEWGKGSSSIKAIESERERVEQSVLEQERSFEWDVYYEVQDFQNLQQQLSISARADTVADRRFTVAKERYLIGKIDITDLFLAQNERDSARRSFFQMLRSYWIGYYTLRRMTLYDFRAEQPIEFDAAF